MKIDLEALKDDLCGWYYEGYGRGGDSFLSTEEARILYDAMVVVNKVSKDNQEFIIEGKNRP